MSFASPGGLHMSSAKKRRLSALDAAAKSSAGKQNAGNQKQHTELQGKRAKASAQPNVQGPSCATASQAMSEPQYFSLDPAIVGGPISQALPALCSSVGKSVNTVLEEAMQTNARAPDMQAAIASRVHNKVFMLDNPTANLLTKARGVGSHKRVASCLLPCSKRPKIVSGQCKYSAIEPLHKLWTQYIADLLRNSSHREALLLDADYHACKLTVTQCPNSWHVGLTGYVITDTSQAFAILSQADKLHRVSKKDTTFQFTLGADQITLYGSQLLKHRA